MRRHQVSCITLLLAIAASLPLEATADQSGYTFLAGFGSAGSGNGQFDTPQQAVVDSHDNIYVVDEFRHRIQKFDSAGNHIFTVGGPTSGSGQGQFHNPTGIALDSSENFFVLDQANNRVQKFASDGTYLGTPISGVTQLGYSIAITPDNSIYVYQQITNEVLKYDTAGTLLLTFGQSGSGDAILNDVIRIAALPDGDILVAQELSPPAVKRFSGAGIYKSLIGSSGSGAGQFNSLCAVGANSAGQIFVSDSTTYQILTYSAAGTFIEAFGGIGSTNGQFNYPLGFGFDSVGRLVIADSGNDRIQIFGPPNLVTVAKDGAGSGTVTSSDNLISCGADCAERYGPANTVTLTASPAEGSYLRAWSGVPCSSRSLTCAFAPATNKTVTASFAIVPATSITQKPQRRTRLRNATFSFRAPGTRVSYQCKLDDGPFRRCTSPKSYERLEKGEHTFQVRAVKNGSPGAAKSATWQIR